MRYNFIIAPVLIKEGTPAAHWYMLGIHPRSRTIEIYDSMTPNKSQLEKEDAIPLRIWRWLWDVDRHVHGRIDAERQVEDELLMWTKIVGVSMSDGVGLICLADGMQPFVTSSMQPARGRQTNSYDCGLWVMQFMQGISQGLTSCEIRSRDLSLTRSNVRATFAKAGWIDTISSDACMDTSSTRTPKKRKLA